jgi:hypothetical protein
MVRARIKRQQVFHRRDKVIGHRATDAAIGQFDDIFRRAIGNGAGLQNIAIHPSVPNSLTTTASLRPPALRIKWLISVVFRAQKAGDDGNGHFGQIGRQCVHGHNFPARQSENGRRLAGKSGRRATAGRRAKRPTPRNPCSPSRTVSSLDGRTVP